MCCCAGNKSLYGTRHLRLSCGNPGVAPLRKPGLTVWEDVRGAKRGSHGVTGASGKRLLPQQRLSLARERDCQGSQERSDGKVL